MTTTTISGISVAYDDDDNATVGSVEAVLEYDLSEQTFYYELTGETEPGNEDVKLASIEDSDLDSAVIDGFDVLAEDPDVAFIEVEWGNSKQSTVMVVFGDDGMYLFQLAGDTIEVETASDWETFDDSITNISVASGDYAPGETISWSNFPDSVTDFEGTSGDDVIDGGNGEGYYVSSEGDDVYTAGSNEYDQLSFANDPGAVTVNLETGTGTDGWGDTDTYSGIEYVRGSAYDDTLTGDDAYNVFRGLEGDDTINGRSGSDEVRYDRDARYGGTDGVTVNLQKGYAIDGFGDTDTLKNIQDARGTEYDDVITGRNGTNVLEGEAGDDWISGLNSTDELYGGEGDDTLEGGKGADELYGEDGADTLMGGKGEDIMYGGDGADYLNGASAADTMDGGKGADEMAGGKGSDIMSGGGGGDDMAGGQGSDTLNGDGGNDTLNGGSSHDTLNGGSGNDILLGGNGIDILNGGEDDDEMTGGGGGDTFVFEGDFGDDLITDFNIGKDGEYIDLSGATGINNFNDLSNNHLSENSDGDAVITDADGNTITLNNIDMSALTSDDFLF